MSQEPVKYDAGTPAPSADPGAAPAAPEPADLASPLPAAAPEAAASAPPAESAGWSGPAPGAAALLLDPRNYVAAGELLTREVELADGHRVALQFRALDAATFNAAVDAERDPVRRTARLIAACVCDEQGRSVLQADQVLRLKPAVYGALRDAMFEACGFGRPGATPAGKA